MPWPLMGGPDSRPRPAAISTLVRDGKVASAVKKIQEIKECLDREEPKNHSLYHNVAKILSRVSGIS